VSEWVSGSGGWVSVLDTIPAAFLVRDLRFLGVGVLVASSTPAITGIDTSSSVSASS
jgi:hypothetical protein